VVTASRSREPTGALPAIGDVPDLAALLDLSIGRLEWLADTGHWNRRVRPGPLHPHRYEWRVRPGRTPRLLEIPSARLRRAQRMLLRDVIALIPVNDAAHGFIPGRSAITGAARHTASDVVISFDLTPFFARVTAGRIYGTLRQSGFSEPVAHMITGLCTNAVPPRVLAASTPGSPGGRRRPGRRTRATPTTSRSAGAARWRVDPVPSCEECAASSKTRAIWSTR
jgi:hypothetical protein